ncbi:TadE/TadG family type IV pilus assembly protein [Vannielia litorea]|uniref:Pilus assembly protein n=1 Tax=Vannielia litorea TaxID=1217970 RepID=A0A1N6FU42_9RHOB|nr:hypothetical protein [Vannielia litorea]SIN98763.1 hypothetical protein SAMN05444002_1958 [Vannielia litorea]
MTLFATLRRRLATFAEDARGSLSVEAALILPLLCWFYVSAFVWFDAYKTQNVNLKATYTLADMLSRETDPVTETYLKGLKTVYGYLSNTRHPSWMRVTTVNCMSNCDSDSRHLHVDWSYATDGNAVLDHATISGYYDKIPFMAQGDTVILLETYMDYKPLFNAGIPATTFENYVVTRPRFAPQLLYAGAGS